MPTIQEDIYAIRQKLNGIGIDINSCKQQDHDISYKAFEENVRRLLNLIYGYNLINLNRVRKNHPAIDLGDRNAELPDGKKGIAVQVTTTKAPGKVRNTVQMFERYELDKQYDRLVIFATEGKEKFATDFDAGNIKFSKENDIWDFSTLMQEIEHIADKDPNKVREIYQFLEHRVTFNPKNYEKHLRRCNEACALASTPDVEFVRDDTLFREIDAFVQYQWLDKLLKEIECYSGKNELTALRRECIDLNESMEEIVRTVTSWLDQHQDDFIDKKINDLKKKIKGIPYRNCLFIMGHYGSGKTRLVTEAALNAWQRGTREERPVYVFVNPDDPKSPENSMRAAFAEFLEKGEDLQVYLDAFVNHPLIIVMDDVHKYIQNDIPLKNLMDLIKRLSRPNIKWILLCQTGYTADLSERCKGDFEQYGHKWSAELCDVSVGPWLQLDTWYRKVDIPWRILQQAEDIPSEKWVSKNRIASTSYYNPLLANVLMIHAHRKQDWSFLGYANLLFPDFCQRYYLLLSQDIEAVRDQALRVADYLWEKHSLRFVLRDTPFQRPDANILGNCGLLLLEENDQFIYQGTPDIVWYYLLAKRLHIIKREKDTNFTDSLRAEYWKENPEDFNGILSLWVLEDSHSDEEITGAWKMLFSGGFASVALDSGLKCHKKLRNNLVKIALKDDLAIRRNFHLFLELCALGLPYADTLYKVVDYCVRNCADEILRYSELFTYMLRQNYATMKQAYVLGMLSHLSPLTAGGKHTAVLRRCGEDIGKSVALKAAGLEQLAQTIDEARKACDGRESNKGEKGSDNANGLFPTGLYDGFCSAFCNTVIQKYKIEGYNAFRSCEWYYFEGQPDKNKDKTVHAVQKINQNQLRRNKALIFALAYEYRNAAYDVEYIEWYEKLVRKMSKGSNAKKTFAYYLIKHTGLKENSYALPRDSELLKIAKDLVYAGSLPKIGGNLANDDFLKWLKDQGNG